MNKLGIDAQVLADLGHEEEFITSLITAEKYADEVNDMYDKILILLESHDDKNINNGGYCTLIQASIGARKIVIKSQNKLSELYDKVYENVKFIL